MERKLKFRVWNKSRNDWLNDSPGTHCFSEYYLDLEGGGLVRFDGSFTDHEERYSRADATGYYLDGTKIVKESPYVIQQFTGLVDKNNKEIYEGDVVKIYNGVHVYCNNFKEEDVIHEVIYGHLNGVKFRPLNATPMIGCGIFPEKPTIYKIIGNIFQNKELLDNE